MSITGLPGQGPVRVGIPIADLSAGIFCAYGILVALHRAREVGRGPVGAHLAAAGADLHARLPGGALADERRSRRAGRQRPPDRHPDRRLPHHATATSTSPPRAHRSRRASATPSARPSCATHPDYATAALALAEPRRAQRRARASIIAPARQRRVGRALNAAGVPCGPIYRSTRCSRTRRCAISASRPVDDIALPRPAGEAQPHAERTSSAPPRRRSGEHTDEVLRELGYDDAGIERLKSQGIV